MDATAVAAAHDHRADLVRLATGMLGDRSAAEDVVQEALGRLLVVDEDLDDVRAWLVVVVRRLCISRLRSAYVRREEVGAADDDKAAAGVDPADRVTLDDEVRLALAVVLDRLTPAERTAFVLHDVFGLPFTSVAEIVGRTPAACRQLASRARRSIRSGDPLAPAVAADRTEARLVTERFVDACAGGDLGALLELLDPAVDGGAVVLGVGPLARVEGAADVATRTLLFLGPDSGTTIVPVNPDGGIIVAVRDGRFGVVRLDVVDGRVRSIHSYIPPASPS